MPNRMRRARGTQGQRQLSRPVSALWILVSWRLTRRLTHTLAPRQATRQEVKSAAPCVSPWRLHGSGHDHLAGGDGTGAGLPPHCNHGEHEGTRRCTEVSGGSGVAAQLAAPAVEALRAKRNIALLRDPPWSFVFSVV